MIGDATFSDHWPIKGFFLTFDKCSLVLRLAFEIVGRQKYILNHTRMAQFGSKIAGSGEKWFPYFNRIFFIKVFQHRKGLRC